MGVYKSVLATHRTPRISGENPPSLRGCTEIDWSLRLRFQIGQAEVAQTGEITHRFTGFRRVKDYVLRRMFRTWAGCHVVRPVRVEIPRRVRQLAMD